MRRADANGSVYVAVVLAVLVVYFGYQAWFNPQRTIKRQLGELAAALSIPEEGTVDRLARLQQIGVSFSEDARVRLNPSGSQYDSREAIIAALGRWTPPPGGLNVEFVDVQVALDSNADARAYMTVQLTGRDARTGELARDSRDMRVTMAKRGDRWLVTAAEPMQASVPARP